MVKTCQYRLVNYQAVTENPFMTTADTPLVALRRARLQQWINDHHEGKQADFVRAAGVNQGELSLLLKNKSFGEKRAAAIEKAAGMPAGYLSSGDETLAPKISTVLETEMRAGDYVRVDQLDGDAGMGEGRINDDYPDVIRSMDLTPAYIRSVVGFVPQPGRLVLVTGRGDSMIPVIQPGESLIVDTGVSTFDGDGIYLINTGNGQQIKGLQDRGDAIYVVSANAALYPAFALPRGAIVGGKVYLRNRIDRLN
ncbi:helix-turn-helix transcriptional regulator [Xanthomonas campestris]|nr:helix-turn-helix transcriptional regulator [Xanthomonas campestris]